MEEETTTAEELARKRKKLQGVLCKTLNPAAMGFVCLLMIEKFFCVIPPDDLLFCLVGSKRFRYNIKNERCFY
jgi:hypothetical protein